MTKSQALRELFKGKKIIRVMGAHNALGAKLAERAGFDAVWASGLEISTSHCLPDANILTMTDFLNAASSMNEAISIPVIADCDTGFGNSNNVMHMVRKYEDAGIAAVCIEDKHFPKVNSFIPGRQELASVSEFIGKILAAKNTQKGKDFLVIARVEALIAGWGMDEALERASAYVDAGADAILIHSKSKKPDEIKEFTERWKNKAPLVVVPTTYFHVKAEELERMKIKMVIYANHGIRSVISAMQKTFKEIRESGNTAGVEANIASMNEVFEIQGMHKMKKDELVYSAPAKERISAVIPAAGDHLEENSMKAISSDIPISMLDINGKPLLQRQVEVLNRCKVYDVRVVAGYKREKIAVEGINVVENSRYKDTGILYSIMKALETVEHKAFIVYGDILFDHLIFERLSESSKDITILLDRRYGQKGYGPEKRLDLAITDDKTYKNKPLLHADSLKKVVSIGSDLKKAEAPCEFPGIAFLSPKGVKTIKSIYKSADKNFEKGTFADLLGEAVRRGADVFAIEADSGWMEIHSLENYKLACSLLK